MMWPDYIYFKKPFKGMTKLLSWYDFDLEAYTMNHDDAIKSAALVMDVIQ